MEANASRSNMKLHQNVRDSTTAPNSMVVTGDMVYKYGGSGVKIIFFLRLIAIKIS
jgi:hypothetical protein